MHNVPDVGVIMTQAPNMTPFVNPNIGCRSCCNNEASAGSSASKHPTSRIAYPKHARNYFDLPSGGEDRVQLCTRCDNIKPVPGRPEGAGTSGVTTPMGFKESALGCSKS